MSQTDNLPKREENSKGLPVNLLGRIWVLDTEGNGSQPGEIIELAAVEMIGLAPTGKYHQWRFKPKIPVSYSATRVHGITNRDLSRCPPIEDHLDEIRSVVQDTPIAGHAVHVEINAIQQVMPDWEPPHAFDTLRMARRAFPELSRHRLGAIGDHLDLSAAAERMTGRKAHSALYDALLTALVLRTIAMPLGRTEQAAMAKHCEVMASRRQSAIDKAKQAAKNELKRKYRESQSQ